MRQATPMNIPQLPRRIREWSLWMISILKLAPNLVGLQLKLTAFPPRDHLPVMANLRHLSISVDSLSRFQVLAFCKLCMQSPCMLMPRTTYHAGNTSAGYIISCTIVQIKLSCGTTCEHSWYRSLSHCNTTPVPQLNTPVRAEGACVVTAGVCPGACPSCTA